MNEFNPEGPRDIDPATSAYPEPSREPDSAFTYPPGSPSPSFSGYAAPEASFLVDQSRPPRLIPNILHTLLFFLLALVLIVLAEVAAIVLYQFFHHASMTQPGLDKTIQTILGNPVLSILTQGAAYGLLILLSIPVFEAIWFQSFGEALHWRFQQARRYFWRLAAIGLGAGLLISSLSNFLPMPKNPPILHDMMASTSGAWMLFLFGVTAAPVVEELAFRGFLLPSLLNIFRWLERLGISNQTVTRYIGIPVSILLTTIPFALLHAQQVSDAWAPLLLIATVSVILCIVRLVTNSVAAGAVVHSAYNFVLFAGLIVQTNGFQHLHKLAS
jgi:membrane protease YdiL (CAAX protease family)